MRRAGMLSPVSSIPSRESQFPSVPRETTRPSGAARRARREIDTEAPGPVPGRGWRRVGSRGRIELRTRSTVGSAHCPARCLGGPAPGAGRRLIRCGDAISRQPPADRRQVRSASSDRAPAPGRACAMSRRMSRSRYPGADVVPASVFHSKALVQTGPSDVPRGTGTTGAARSRLSTLRRLASGPADRGFHVEPSRTPLSAPRSRERHRRLRYRFLVDGSHDQGRGCL